MLVDNHVLFGGAYHAGKIYYHDSHFLDVRSLKSKQKFPESKLCHKTNIECAYV